MGPDAMIFVFWMLNFKPTFSLSTFTFHFHALEKEMATHSSVLAWRISGTAEPGGLLSKGSHRVRHDWSDLAAAAAGGDCSHEIKRHLFLGRKAMTNLDSLLKSRNITLLTKVCLDKAMVFPVVINGYESCTIKKDDCWRIDGFELWCWRRFLRVPRNARRSNQSILKEINAEYTLEGLILKLKLQCFGHLMWITNSLEERLKAGGEEDNRGWDGWKASPIQCTWVWAGSESWWWTGKPDMGLQPMGLQSRTWLSNGTKLTEIFIKFHLLIFFFWKSCLCYPI